MTPEKLINWSELSRLLSGSRSVITPTRRGKKHAKAISELEIAIKNWWSSLN
jgi:hypothetical protein